MSDYYVIFESDAEIICVNAAKGKALRLTDGDLADYAEGIAKLGVKGQVGAGVTVVDVGLALCRILANSELATKVRAHAAEKTTTDHVKVRPCLPVAQSDYNLVFIKGRETDAG